MGNYAIEKLKELVDVHSLLTSLGFTIFTESVKEIRCSCVIHGGDNKTAFSFNKETRRFYCYSRGCELDDNGNLNNDIISLIMAVNKCSFMNALNYLSNLTGITVDFNSINELEEDSYRKSRERDRFITYMSSKEELPVLSENILSDYISAGAKYFEALGIDKEVIEKYELGTFVDDMGVERGAVPIRDDKGNLVSVSGRRTDGDEEPRYLLVKNFKKREVLYNLHNALKYIDDYDKIIIIVEGFKALWAVYSCGFKNVVAVMGKSVSREQINLLVRYGYRYTLLMLDGDEAGSAGTLRSEKLLRGKMSNLTIHLGNKKSPDDLERKDLYDLISLFYSALGGKTWKV